jgi:hypothetical protein
MNDYIDIPSGVHARLARHTGAHYDADSAGAERDDPATAASSTSAAAARAEAAALASWSICADTEAPESMPPRAGAMASLRPQFSLPPARRQPILVVAPVLIAVWALAGFYGSLAPSLIRSSFGLDSSLLGGIALFVLAGSGGTSVLFTQRLEPRTLMIYGATVLFTERGDCGQLALVPIGNGHSSSGPRLPGAASARASKARSGPWCRSPRHRSAAACCR